MRNEKGSRNTARAVLSTTEQIALIDILRARYVESGMDDTAFAKSVNDSPLEKAKFQRFDVVASHVVTIRKALGIEGNRARRKPDPIGECLGLTARVAELEAQMEKLATYVKTLRK